MMHVAVDVYNRQTDECVVTSGVYQRTYMVDGKLYHHIIDPETLYPGTYWRSVTIVCRDSGAADALSTALFIMSKEEGQSLLEKYDAEALWAVSYTHLLRVENNKKRKVCFKLLAQ